MVFKPICFRAGYFHEHDTKGGRKYLTFGSGVKNTMFFDFSYLISTSNIGGTNPLANTMRFTLIFDLGSMGANEDKSRIWI